MKGKIDKGKLAKQMSVNKKGCAGLRRPQCHLCKFPYARAAGVAHYARGH